MYKKLLIGILIAGSISLAGCTSTGSSSLVTKSDSEYVHIVDYTKISAVEYHALNSGTRVDTQWINLPTKKITRAEYEELLEASKKK